MQAKSYEKLAETRAEVALFQVTIPADLLGHIKSAAKQNERSANKEIVYVLRQHYGVPRA
jgi:Arc-like DNA binding domain